MQIDIFSWIDAIFDRVAQRLAENMTDNIELFEQNKVSRQRAHASFNQQEQARAKDPIPWYAVYSQIPVNDLKRSLVFFQDKIEYRPSERVLFLA